jgi:rubrerythrin
MQMELDGKEFYLRGAQSTREQNLKKIFEMLAEEEERHYRVFRKLLEGDAGAESELDTGGAAAMDASKTIFKQLADRGATTLVGSDARSLWQKAREIEEKSEKLYRDRADEEKDEGRKRLLNRIADEEKSHIYLVDNVLVYLRDPEQFRDSQQFKNFMSWEGH